MPLAVNVALRMLFAIGVLAMLLFASAGHLRLPMFWAWLGVSFGVGLAGMVFVARKDPTLLQERFRPGPGGRDRLTRKMMVLVVLVSLGVAAFDVGRWHWSRIPFAFQLAALGIVAATMGVWMWAMSVNRFFSSEVRVQRDRGHHVITAGPYRWVRHPGYA